MLSNFRMQDSKAMLQSNFGSVGDSRKQTTHPPLPFTYTKLTLSSRHAGKSLLQVYEFSSSTFKASISSYKFYKVIGIS